MRNKIERWTNCLSKLGFTLKKQRRHGRRNCLTRALGIEPLEQRQLLSITVNTFVDERDFNITTDGDISLRDAILEAPIGETIDFDPVLLNGQTIMLQSGLGEIAFDKSLTIDASMLEDGITIDASSADLTPEVKDGQGIRIFNITDPTFGSAPPTVEFVGLTLTGADSNSGGGAIRSQGHVTIRDCLVRNNASGGSGGGLSVALYSYSSAVGAVVITGSTFENNMARGGSGGAIWAVLNTGTSMTIADSIISGNESRSSGGGIAAFPDENTLLTITNSLISGNTAYGDGGGLFTYASNGAIGITGSTITDNTAYGDGGGLFGRASNGSITIEKTRLYGNRIITSGGVIDGGGAFLSCLNSSVTITGTTVTDNWALGIEANAGGIAIYANLNSDVQIDRLEIVGNLADDDVGGLLISNSASLVSVKNSTISGNKASHNNSYEAAGGVLLIAFDGGTNIIESSTISNNETFTPSGEVVDNVAGGGVFIIGEAETTTTIRNSTISGNRAEGSGGGIKINEEFYDQGGEVRIEHCTITNNRADSDDDSVGTGGGIHVGNSTTTVTLDHTIVADNSRGTGTTGHDIDGPVTGSYNLVGDGRGANVPNNGTNQIGFVTTAGLIDPDLLPLGFNGGLTQTHMPLAGSPVIDMGDPNFDPANPDGNPMTDDAIPFDQRGEPFGRLADGDDNATARIDIGAIEWQPNPLTGDYNFNGVVDAADYTVWRDTLGTSVPNFSGADGDGDGVIGVNDYAIWVGAFGNLTGSVLADFSGNGATDIADYNLWVSTYGSTTDLRADANEDGVVDNADFDIWFDTFGSTLGIAQFGLLSSMFDPDAPPAVVGFALSLPGSTTVDFAGRVGSGEQIRSVPLIAANTVSVTFNQDVVVTQNALAVINLDGASPSVQNFAYDAASQTATWTFTAALANGRYLVRLADSIVNGDNEALDGEFSNPWSLAESGTTIFPSGDGTAGGEFRFRFTVLFGDSDHDNIDGTTNYQNWQSYEPGRIYVSTTADEFDGDLSFGDVSLREAVDHANAASEATTIELPAGRYSLTLAGTEVPGTGQNDLDVSGNLAILGAGAGVSVIVPGAMSPQENRAFEVNGAAARLRLERVTVTGAYSWASPLGAAALVQNQAELEIVDSAIVANIGYGTGIAIRSLGSDVTILRSVFTNNQGYDGVAVEASEQGANTGSLTIGESIFALNTNWGNYAGTTPNVKASSSVLKTNLGNNLYDNAAGGFFDVVSGAGDYLGTPHYVVTTVADTFDHTNDWESLSIREAVDKANTTAGVQEIWIPAWHFVLTRDRGGLTSDVDTALGDLDVKESLIVRGVAERTSIAWKAGVVDEVFDLLGDYNNDGEADVGNVSAADNTIWQDQNGSTGAYEQFSADGDDDGDVDQDDYDIWVQNFGHTLQLLDVLS